MGRSTAMRGYLVTGLVLAAVTAALPLLAWGTPVSVGGPGESAWSWMNSLWRPFGLLAVGVGLAILARAGHSGALAAITVVYIAAVGLAGWSGLQQPLPVFAYGDPGVLLPAAVLLLSGLGALLEAGVRELRR